LLERGGGRHRKSAEALQEAQGVGERLLQEGFGSGAWRDGDLVEKGGVSRISGEAR